MFKSLSTPHVSVCVWKWRFFSLWFGLSSTRVRWKRSAETHLFKSLSRAEIFENAVCWTRVDEGKTNTSRCWIHDPTPRTRWDEMPMLQSKKVPLSVTTAFSFGGEKTIQKRNVRRKAEKKISTFKQKRIRVNGDWVGKEIKCTYFLTTYTPFLFLEMD